MTFKYANLTEGYWSFGVDAVQCVCSTFPSQSSALSFTIIAPLLLLPLQFFVKGNEKDHDLGFLEEQGYPCCSAAIEADPPASMTGRFCRPSYLYTTFLSSLRPWSWLK